jgi:pyruvate dehydrogenase E1 component beta subunit
VPLGSAEVKREGGHVTIAAWSEMVDVALSAAQRLASEGIELEVVDLRTLKPLDKDTLLSSVEKTGRLVILQAASLTNGFGAEIAALVAEEGYFHLDAPIKRVAAPDVPVPYSTPLEEFYIPGEDDLINTVRELL